MPTKGGATGKFYCLILTENSAPFFLLFIFYYHELKHEDGSEKLCFCMWVHFSIVLLMKCKDKS